MPESIEDDDSRTAIPEDETLRELTVETLREFAEAIPHYPEDEKRLAQLRSDLAHWRDGGIPLRCQRERCHYRWVYGGDNEWTVTCPYCSTSVTIKKNRLDQDTPPHMREKSEAGDSASDTDDSSA